MWRARTGGGSVAQLIDKSPVHALADYLKNSSRSPSATPTGDSWSWRLGFLRLLWVIA
jgi:hypothetical protein